MAEESKIMTLDIIVERYMQDIDSGNVYPIIHENDDVIVILKADGSTDEVRKESLLRDKPE